MKAEFECDGLTKGGIWDGLKALVWGGFEEEFGHKLEFDPIWEMNQWVKQNRPDTYTRVFFFVTEERKESSDYHVLYWLKRLRVQVSVSAGIVEATEIESDYTPVEREISYSVGGGHSDFWLESD